MVKTKNKRKNDVKPLNEMASKSISILEEIQKKALKNYNKYKEDPKAALGEIVA